jgi:hypothetical protein
MGCLLPDPHVATLLNEAGLSSSYALLAPYYWLIECVDRASSITLMRQSGFEEVVFWFSDRREQASDIVFSASVHASLADGRYDTPFLQFLDKGYSFIFYSFNHDNLEILGTAECLVSRYLVSQESTVLPGRGV